MTIQDVFAAVGAEYGYDDVTVGFAQFKDVKLRWQRSFRWISFQVSDLIEGADDSVYEALARTIFARLRGDEPDPDGLLSIQEYARTHTKGHYIDRHTPVKTGRDLTVCLTRLAEAGFIDPADNLTATWTNDRFGSALARSSAIYRHILVSASADDLPDAALDYLIYRHAVRILAPRDGHEREAYIAERMAAYPDNGGLLAAVIDAREAVL